MGGENATILSKADCVGCPVPRAEYGSAVVRLVQWAVETKVPGIAGRADSPTDVVVRFAVFHREGDEVTAQWKVKARGRRQNISSG